MYLTQCYVQRSYVNLGSETTLAVHYLTSPELDFRYLRAAAPTPHPATNDVQVLEGQASLMPRPTQPPAGQQQTLLGLMSQCQFVDNYGLYNILLIQHYQCHCFASCQLGSCGAGL